MIWTLILFAHAGLLSERDSMALVTVPGFRTQVECQNAGDQAKKMTSLTKKDIKYTCVEVQR